MLRPLYVKTQQSSYQDRQRESNTTDEIVPKKQKAVLVNAMPTLPRTAKSSDLGRRTRIRFAPEVSDTLLTITPCATNPMSPGATQWSALPFYELKDDLSVNWSFCGVATDHRKMSGR